MVPGDNGRNRQAGNGNGRKDDRGPERPGMDVRITGKAKEQLPENFARKGRAYVRAPSPMMVLALCVVFAAIVFGLWLFASV